jgi:epoxide hydrolase-like predicted phosphatase
MTIQAILFDLGGVLLRTADFNPRERLAARLGMSRFELEQLIFGRESGDMAQRGEITVHQHYANLCQHLGYSMEQLQAMLEEFFTTDFLDQDLVEYVRQLHRTYKTGLLSNAADDLRKLIAERWHFEDAFDDMVISAEVKLAKPDPRIFRLAVDRLGVIAGEAVFIDDMPHNVDAAVKVGLLGIRFQSPQQFRLDLEGLLNGHSG